MQSAAILCSCRILLPSRATCLPVYLIAIMCTLWCSQYERQQATLPRSVSLVRYSFPARSAPEATEQIRTVDSWPLARVDGFLGPHRRMFDWCFWRILKYWAFPMVYSQILPKQRTIPSAKEGGIQCLTCSTRGTLVSKKTICFTAHCLS